MPLTLRDVRWLVPLFVAAWLEGLGFERGLAVLRWAALALDVVGIAWAAWRDGRERLERLFVYAGLGIALVGLVTNLPAARNGRLGLFDVLVPPVLHVSATVVLFAAGRRFTG